MVMVMVDGGSGGWGLGVGLDWGGQVEYRTADTLLGILNSPVRVLRYVLYSVLCYICTWLAVASLHSLSLVHGAAQGLDCMPSLTGGALVHESTRALTR